MYTNLYITIIKNILNYEMKHELRLFTGLYLDARLTKCIFQ